jgi:phosphoribosylformylglycinamidine synthase
VAEVRVLILRAAGTNCDLETKHAWELVGARPDLVHVRRLIEQPGLLGQYQVLTIPGGFSYGDDIAAGRILAAQLTRGLIDELHAFIDAGRLVLGICNGFQVLVTAGLLPFRTPAALRKCAITHNDPPGFQDRWVTLRATTDRCAFLEAGREYEMPIAHGEGRVMFADDGILQQVERDGHKAVCYVESPSGAGVSPGAPANPNGSTADIAGLCDETGHVLGLMPHPERFVTWTQYPSWASQPERPEGDGLAIFRRAVSCLT